MATITRRVPREDRRGFERCDYESCHLCFVTVVIEQDTKATDEEMHEWLTEELAKDAALLTQATTERVHEPIVTDGSMDFLSDLLHGGTATAFRERTR